MVQSLIVLKLKTLCVLLHWSLRRAEHPRLCQTRIHFFFGCVKILVLTWSFECVNGYTVNEKDTKGRTRFPRYVLVVGVLPNHLASIEVSLIRSKCGETWWNPKAGQTMLDCPTQPRRPCAVCICHCEAKICRSQIDKRPSEMRTPQENSHPQNGAVNPRPQLEDRTKCFRQLHGLLPDINGIQLDHIREGYFDGPINPFTSCSQGRGMQTSWTPENRLFLRKKVGAPQAWNSAWDIMRPTLNFSEGSISN